MCAAGDIEPPNEDMLTTSSGSLDASNSADASLETCRGPDLEEEDFGRKRQRLPVNYAQLHEGSS